MKKVVILKKNGFACYFDNHIPINHPFIKGDDDGLKAGRKMKKM
jgi:hypothetical protein